MLRVCFSCYGSYTTDSVYQWDQNHNLEITGINSRDVSAVHFCNKKSEEAIVVNVTKRDETVIVPIPNELLQDPLDVIGYVHSVDENNAKTIEVVHIPLRKRPKPSDYQFTDNIEIKNFERLEADWLSYKDELLLITVSLDGGYPDSEY